MRRRAERKGYVNWERALSAGIVDEKVAFTDNQTLTDLTLGNTKQTMGMCYPMDLAVAYTLASVGPDKMLNAEDMVNEYTRTAYVMMGGKVGWGEVPNPDGPICGHDMVNAYLHKWPEARLDKHGRIYFASNQMYRSDFTFRLNEKARHEISPVTLIHSDTFKKLKEKIEQELDAKEWAVSGGSGHFRITHTYGECNEAMIPDGEKCAHHSPIYERMWFLIEENDDYLRIWDTGAVSRGWNNDQLNSQFGWNEKKNISATQVTRFSEVRRKLARDAPLKGVIKEIKKALTRMGNWTSERSLIVNDAWEEMNISIPIGVDDNGEEMYEKQARRVSTRRGKYTKYGWKDWDWVAKIDVQIQESNTKARKEGETQCSICFSKNVKNDLGHSYCECGKGWKYKRYQVERMHGHEIVKFRWEPIEKPSVFGFKDFEYTGIFFKKISEATNVRNMFHKALNHFNATQRKDRVWDSDEGVSSDIKVEWLSEKRMDIREIVTAGVMTLPWNSDPEYTLTPIELLHKMCFGSPQDWEEAMELSNSVGDSDGRIKLMDKHGSYVTMWIHKPTEKVIVEEEVVA
ncbi:MAG: hypothetical protein CMF55_03240 [Legionellales bacterium]|nr:hypothetical protein [Legionellales bacterium]|tara:strand:- start:28453 stop:30171 length:1719 start_codon:yes stop_codon:yes gene_type:complete